MKILTFLSLKGGTGKTTTVYNVSCELARRGKRVLAVDLDPQGYLTYSFGEGTAGGRKSVFDVINGMPVREAIRETKSGVHLLAADLELTTSDLTMREAGREYVMKNAIQGLPYDVCVFDCCPYLGILSLNALVAAQDLIIPTEPEFLAMKGVRQLYLKVVQMVQRELNPELRFSGVVITRYDSRKSSHKTTSEKLHQLFKDQMFNTRIRNNVAISVATSLTLPVFAYDRNSNGAKDYAALTDEIVLRYNL
jgi:chromosome partitioning protein